MSVKASMLVRDVTLVLTCPECQCEVNASLDDEIDCFVGFCKECDDHVFAVIK